VTGSQKLKTHWNKNLQNDEKIMFYKTHNPDKPKTGRDDDNKISVMLY
jgi:hypothetical protein